MNMKSDDMNSDYNKWMWAVEVTLTESLKAEEWERIENEGPLLQLLEDMKFKAKLEINKTKKLREENDANHT